MNEYNLNEAGLPPTIPPPVWIHNVTCYSPRLLEDQFYLQNSFPSFGSFLRSLLIVTSTIAIILGNSLFLIVLNRETFSSKWIKAQPRLIFSALALNDLANGLIVLGVGIFPAIFECWPFGELTCQVQALFRGAFAQQASLTMIVLAIERYLASVHPLTFQGFCSQKACILTLLCCLCFSVTLYALIVIPPGGFHFNVNGMLVCEPYFISNNVLALAACLLYFPTTMILMYCYGTIFHSAKVRVRYKKAVLTSLPFVRGEENANRMAKQIVADKRICDATSQTSAAISLLYIIVVTPWAVQQVIISCTRTIAPPNIDFFVSWIANSHRFWTPLIYWMLNEQFRTELHSYLLNKLQWRPLSKTWLVRNGSSAAAENAAEENGPNSNNFFDIIESAKLDNDREQHWGEILERTVSKQNLMSVNNVQKSSKRQNRQLASPNLSLDSSGERRISLMDRETTGQLNDDLNYA